MSEGPRFADARMSAVVVDDRAVTLEEVAECVRFARKYQSATLDEILKDRGLIPLTAWLELEGEQRREIGDDWVMSGGYYYPYRGLMAALHIPHTWFEDRDEERARKTLRQKVSELGDRIWEAWTGKAD